MDAAYTQFDRALMAPTGTKGGIDDAVTQVLAQLEPHAEQCARVAKILQLSFGSPMWRSDRDHFLGGIQNVAREIGKHLSYGGSTSNFHPQPSIVAQVGEMVHQGYAVEVPYWTRIVGARTRKHDPYAFDTMLSILLERGERYAHENLSSD